jgi:hypothetical protein
MVRVLLVALSVASMAWFGGCGGSATTEEKPSVETQAPTEEAPAAEEAPAPAPTEDAGGDAAEEGLRSHVREAADSPSPLFIAAGP